MDPLEYQPVEIGGPGMAEMPTVNGRSSDFPMMRYGEDAEPDWVPDFGASASADDIEYYIGTDGKPHVAGTYVGKPAPGVPADLEIPDGIGVGDTFTAKDTTPVVPFMREARLETPFYLDNRSLPLGIPRLSIEINTLDFLTPASADYVGMPGGNGSQRPGLEVDDYIGAGLEGYSSIYDDFAGSQGVPRGMLSVASHVANAPGIFAASFDLMQTGVSAANGDTRGVFVQGGGALAGTAGAVVGGFGGRAFAGGIVFTATKFGYAVPTPITWGIATAGSIIGGLLMTEQGKNAGDVAADKLDVPKKK